MCPAKYMEPYLTQILPQLIFHENLSQDKLSFLAKLFSKDQPEDFFIDNCPILFSYILISHPTEEEKNTAFSRISELIGAKKEDLILSYCESIVIELVLKLGEYPFADSVSLRKTAQNVTSTNKALNGLLWLKDFKDPSTTIEDFANKFLLSILSKINTLFSTEASDTRYQETILRSFQVILSLVGRKNLQAVTFKVVRTLEIVTKKPGLELTACDTWLKFVKLLDPPNLGPLLTQIFMYDFQVFLNSY